MSDLLTAFNGLRKPRILILGDLMLDRYTWGDAERISPEAPVIVLQADQEEVRPGGAASVAYLLRHLEADVSLAGAVGNDPNGNTLRALLRDEAIDDRFVVTDTARPTTTKHRFVGRASDRHPHQILRVDHESRVPLSEILAQQIWDSLQDSLIRFDAILVSDYLKGVCTEQLLAQVIAFGREHEIPVLIDPGKTTDYRRYQGATLLKPNRSEAELFSQRSIPTVEAALQCARQLREILNLESAVITLDRAGLVTVDGQGEYSAIPTAPRDVYDITGAGDMVLAGLGLCISSGLSVIDAARIANVAAGLEVERFGIAPVRRSEIAAKLLMSSSRGRSKIVTLEDATQLAAEYRRQGKRVVFTNGCFDLLHVGHVSYLQEAAILGDVLIVAVNSDASVKRLKGPTRPVISDGDRSTMLASLECIDHVLIFEEDTPHRLLQAIKPDCLVKGATTDQIVGREVVESYGGKVYRTANQLPVSTTAILNTVQAEVLK